MPLLIDGHNLINALPDIDLADPNDEVLLIEKLRAYCGRTGKRCTVVFDSGIPGGRSRKLSTPQVEVIFAAAYRTNADRIIRRRIRQARDPGALTVVSTDHEIRHEAEVRRMRVLPSEDFAAQIGEAMAPAVPDERPDDVHLTDREIEYWLRCFGEEDEE